MAAAEKQNRCVVDAGRFHCPVIDIPPDTTCPRCDLIFHDTTELQRHLASTEYLPPEGHSLVINAEPPDSACGSALRQKIRDRWRARRAQRETKTSNSSLKGRRTTCRWEARARGRREPPLCGLSQQVREVRGAVFMCWMIKHEAPEFKKTKEQLRAHSELAATKGKDTALVHAAQWERPTQLVWQISCKRGTIWNRREHSIWYLIASWPKVYDPALSRLELVISVAQHREHFRGALGQTRANRLLGQAPPEHWNGHCRQRSNRIEKSEFCRSITSRLTNQTPSATG